jgi:hypothetical protein
MSIYEQYHFDELSQDDIFYFSLQVKEEHLKYENKSINEENKDLDNCPKTESGQNKPKTIEANPEEVINKIYIKNLFSNNKRERNHNKNKQKISDEINKSNYTSNTATFTKKKRGRRNKNSTETDGHTGDSKDNQIKKYWIIFLNSILNLINSIPNNSKYKLSPTNFAQQFGPSIVENEEFIKLKIYKYFTYNTVFKDDDIKKHEEIGTKNAEIIKKIILDEKNDVYIGLMKSSIETMYQKYITINGRIKKDITNFKTIDDIVKEKEKVLKEKKNKDEIEKELEDFKNNASTLVEYIITKGQEIKRKTDNTKVKKYITIDELEHD